MKQLSRSVPGQQLIILAAAVDEDRACARLPPGHASTSRKISVSRLRGALIANRLLRLGIVGGAEAADVLFSALRPHQRSDDHGRQHALAAAGTLSTTNTAGTP